MLLALFGATMGQGVMWVTGQFYAQIFLENIVKIEFNESRYILIFALVLALPFYIFFGYLSDLIGRKWIMLLGMLLGVLTFKPIYQKILDLSDVEKLEKTQQITMGQASYKNEVLANLDTVITTTIPVTLKNNVNYVKKYNNTISNNHVNSIKHSKISYEYKVFPKHIFIILVLLVFIQILYGTMTYAPIAAYLVELFPIKIRYTSLSLPYHIGNGFFGGLVPFLATLLFSYSPEDKLAGLNYSIFISLICFNYWGCIYEK
ncbi:MAG: hypothetical protein ORN85_09340 [Sediminibacterium sp.]|nr:hypothetical protein [Sediminibacterium sp.]